MLSKKGEEIKDSNNQSWFTYWYPDFFKVGFSKSINKTSEKLKIDKGNISKCLNGKRQSADGYNFQRLEMMYSGLDTLELHFKGEFHYLDLSCERAKADEYGICDFTYSGRSYTCLDWSFKPYSFIVTDVNKCFQIAFNKRRIHIKVLSQAFYFDGYDRLFKNLAKEIQALFQLDIDRFNIIRFDWACDIKFPYKYTNYLSNKDFGGLVKGQIHSFHDRNVENTNHTSLTKNVVFRIYDKVLESKDNHQKRDMFYRLYGIDEVCGDFAIDDYLKGSIQILRFEYQIRNGNGFIAKYVLPSLKDFNPDYLRGIVYDVIQRHTKIKNDFTDVIDDIFNSPINFAEKVDKIEVLDDKIMHLENSVKAHLSSYIAHKRIRNQYDGVVLPYIKIAFHLIHDLFKKTNIEDLINEKYSKSDF